MFCLFYVMSILYFVFLCVVKDPPGPEQLIFTFDHLECLALSNLCGFHIFSELCLYNGRIIRGYELYRDFTRINAYSERRLCTDSTRRLSVSYHQ